MSSRSTSALSRNLISHAQESKVEISTHMKFLRKMRPRTSSRQRFLLLILDCPEVKKDVEGDEVESKDDAKESQTEDVMGAVMELNDTEENSISVEKKTKEASEKESRKESKTGDVAVEEVNSESQHVNNDIVPGRADAEPVKVEPRPENANEVIAEGGQGGGEERQGGEG
ncbi:hypothetical protein B0I72DRAFT_161844 [Yarrowia lipolytica]|uniref:YALI0B00682p n=2 Tax=Yarrowia lipolytica TaxID=4952 RepID=Q6CG58_YARLI|nr:YALI0B00682p [Yarrowia lipolytica CLIB122]AOW01022.1 hypothetical protein YALI1_B01223g [Yarrowia lipolytica]KAB8281511.1 hypothetical protein BKA91DRAFT_163345 [Yarrowia lipolytica]KAJ8051946.1 hypothetical protein LXG23DRAFT_51451 [Yarrowia lipolytica]RDW24859.1 hypothetical protein B0I71DRAFT_171543 [Yarrowia lipolytica]RDW31208.1 hypothetical protein B0I72DRAFT_161844 [Yarrowia lipolytica]|eukprot:XP_500354.2 YALI0B00682p [Yarrowia lipolytica CLIB122]